MGREAQGGRGGGPGGGMGARDAKGGEGARRSRTINNIHLSDNDCCHFLYGCCILSISAAVSCVLTTILVFAAPGPRALIPRAPNDTDGSHYCLWMRGHEIYRGCGVPPTNIIPWPYGLEGCKMR